MYNFPSGYSRRRIASSLVCIILRSTPYGNESIVGEWRDTRFWAAFLRSAAPSNASLDTRDFGSALLGEISTSRRPHIPISRSKTLIQGYQNASSLSLNISIDAPTLLPGRDPVPIVGKECRRCHLLGWRYPTGLRLRIRRRSQRNAIPEDAIDDVAPAHLRCQSETITEMRCFGVS
jgi:hypothetical protein